MASSVEIVPTILATSPEQYQQFVTAYQGFAVQNRKRRIGMVIPVSAQLGI